MRQMDIVDLDKFQFTRNWFRKRNLATLREYVQPFWVGRKLVYLEIGVFEGQSMVWAMQYILTHPESRAVGIDPWLQTEKISGSEMEQVMQRALHNTEPWRDRCLLNRANSAELLRIMARRRGFAGITRGSLDLCMIDGNHNALAVWDDCRLVYECLRPGGWFLMDDVENDLPKKDHVKEGLSLFLDEIGDGVQFLWKSGYMEAYMKRG